MLVSIILFLVVALICCILIQKYSGIEPKTKRIVLGSISIISVVVVIVILITGHSFLPNVPIP